jgi:putative membrane protein
MKRTIRFVFFLLVLALGLFFGLLNAEPVSVNYYFGTRQLPLSLILVLTLVCGALAGLLAGIGPMFRLRRELRRLRKEMRNTEKELGRARAFAVKDER